MCIELAGAHHTTGKYESKHTLKIDCPAFEGEKCFVVETDIFYNCGLTFLWTPVLQAEVQNSKYKT